MGLGILQAGGNAVDAAVTTALCQGVMNPAASGLGGGHFMLVRTPGGEAELVDAREVAPAAAHRDMFKGALEGGRVEGWQRACDGLVRRGNPAASVDGGLAVAVPLELKGLHLAHSRHGRLPWSKLFEPVIPVARSGFATHPFLVASISNINTTLLSTYTELRDAFFIRDKAAWRPPAVNETCCARPALAQVLEQGARVGVLRVQRRAHRGDLKKRECAGGLPRHDGTQRVFSLTASFLSNAVAQRGPDALYKGALAKLLVADVAAAGGILTEADLSSAEALVRPVARMEALGLDLLVPPPPTSSLAVALALRVLTSTRNWAACRSVEKINQQLLTLLLSLETHFCVPPTSPDYSLPLANSGSLGLHRTVEALKHAAALRLNLGDPGPPGGEGEALAVSAVADVAGEAYAASLRRAIRDDQVLDALAYGGSWNLSRAGARGDDHGTSHVNVVDAEGMAVSMTTTINLGFGSKVLSKSTGILLNNQMDDFSTPGQFNALNLPPSEKNFISPGKKPYSSMSPIIVEQGGRLRCVLGASGGPRIISAVVQTLLRLWRVKAMRSCLRIGEPLFKAFFSRRTGPPQFQRRG
ncbi:gamma-glutamyltranspeptidase [Helicosporidium sp. ATCC 50920]|nr:gamma-glutamyltranspeptidase [Helicosporidium sp. ATCC 50920]|eukprot:KDD74433.1 gamma-glutamyltranspeptidase [Helicosporidium sp. ATCC 50920]